MGWLGGIIIGLLIGTVLGASSINESEGKKAKDGKCTVFDGEIYRYVKVDEEED